MRLYRRVGYGGAQVCWRWGRLPEWTSGLDPDDPHLGSFWGRDIIGAISDHRHHRECKHDEGHMAVPAMPEPGFVVVEAKLVFGSLEAAFDRSAAPFNRD